MSDLSLLSGFAKGFAQTRYDADERERRKEAFDIEKMNKQLQQKQMALASQLLKIKAAKEEREWQIKSDIYNEIKSGKQRQAAEREKRQEEQPQFGSSILDDLAGYGIDPTTAGLVGGEIQDIYKNQMEAARFSETRRANDMRERQNEINNAFKIQETHPGVTVPTPGGGERLIYPRKYQLGQEPPALGPSPLSSMGGGGIQTKLPDEDTPIATEKLPLWIHPVTMERAVAGMTPAQAERMGFKQVTTGQLEKVQKINAVQNVIDKVRQLMSDVIPTSEPMGRIGGLVRQGSAEIQMTKEGRKLALLKDYIMGNRAQVAKALGEVGNLSESEQEAVVKMFGDIGDSGPKAWQQFALLEQTFQDAKASAFGVKKVDDSPPLTLLQPGKKTKFKNGQIWTVIDGNKVRLK